MGTRTRLLERNVESSALKSIMGLNNSWGLKDCDDSRTDINEVNKIIEKSFMIDLFEAKRDVDMGGDPSIIAARIHVSMLSRLMHFQEFDSTSDSVKSILVERINRELELPDEATLCVH